jgi:hypothetical protein
MSNKDVKKEVSSVLLLASGGFTSKTVLVESEESYSDKRASRNPVPQNCVTREIGELVCE